MSDRLGFKPMRIEDKLSILADAAKYDVSCASSGSHRKNYRKGLGHTAPSGICHTYTEDGRCVSLLKLLFTNTCIYDRAYCVNRSGNDIPRAAFTTTEIVELTIDFYRRNYIEGLFLSSGVFKSPNETMERLVRVVRRLRGRGFNGYIHLKCVPYTSGELIRLAGLYADRLSVNIELPTEQSLIRLAQDKSFASVLKPMGMIKAAMAETREDRKRLRHAPNFAPAGQSTQLIIGASPESDYDILFLADDLYRHQALKRVYYSAFMPPEKRDHRLPDITEPPLVRENRLYQADWLIRLYGFALCDLVDPVRPNLDLTMDPKQTFARRHPELFPVNINTADRELILRVPGIGVQSANRIIRLRRLGRIRHEHLKQMGVVIGRALPFIHCDGTPGRRHHITANHRSGMGQPDDQKCWSFTNRRIRAERCVFMTDATFEGLLSAVFEAYAGPWTPDAIESGNKSQRKLFQHQVFIETDHRKAERVWQGLKIHLGVGRRRQIYLAFLSAASGVETSIGRFIFDSIPTQRFPGQSVQLTAQLEIEKLSRKVRREAHRMKGFVRFQQVTGDQYLAVVAPKYDVLPLIRRHFEERFSDQQWVIYDTRRNYGFLYDRQHTREVHMDVVGKDTSDGSVADNEALCRALWRRYYQAANIAERTNPKLHLRQLPRRYWRYLPEKYVKHPLKPPAPSSHTASKLITSRNWP